MSEVKLPILDRPVPSKPKKILGVRHIQFVLMFFTMVIFIGIRSSMSVAIIPMTEETPPDDSIPTYPEWDNTDTILSSFFWGYILPQLAAGQLSEYFGPKWFLVFIMAFASVLQIAIPFIAHSVGSTGVIICRMLQGINIGFLYPSLHHLISCWSPLFERATVSNFVYGGDALGTGISMVLIGAICASNLGWTMSFYVYGGVGLTWALIFAIFAVNLPALHKNISVEERAYIEDSNFVTHTTKKIPTPWKSIFTSLPVWAIWVSGASQCFGNFTLMTEVPSYMSSIMNFDIKDNSKLSALPYFTLFVLGLITSPISDRLVARKIISISTARKVFNSLGSFIPGAALIYLSFVDSSQKTLVTALLIVTTGSIAFTQSGFLLNLIDVAPNHAGTLIGLVNGTDNIFSILGPLTVGLFGSDKTDPILWRKVFLLTAGIFIGCGIFYDIFTTSEVQPWNDIQEAETKKDSEKNEKKTDV